MFERYIVLSARKGPGTVEEIIDGTDMSICTKENEYAAKNYRKPDCFYVEQPFGIHVLKTCSKRPAELRALQGYLQMFETEISFMSNVLKDALQKYTCMMTAVLQFFSKARWKP